MNIDPEGVRVWTDYGNSLTSWKAILRIVNDEDHIFLLVSDLSGFIIPKRSFRNRDEMAEFLLEANTLVKKSKAMK